MDARKTIATDTLKNNVMTTKELAKALGVDISTVTKTVNRLKSTSEVLPKFKQGQTPRYTEEQATLIKQEIQKHHNLASRQIDETTFFDEQEVACISKELKNNTSVQQQIDSNGKFMTIRNVADVLNVSYSAVYRAVCKLFPDKMKNGRLSILNEIEVSAISKELKGDYHISQLTFSAGEKVKNTTTDLEIIGNAISAFSQLQELYTRKEAEYKATIQNQKQQLIEQQPKVEFYDDVTGSKDTIDMKEVAKILNIKNIGRNKLFEILRNKNILDRCNQPYQKYVDAGYFRVIESRFNLPDGEIKISLKTVVFQKGLDFIRRELAKKSA